MQKIFLTGANGFVGKHFINTVKEQYHIIGLTHQGDLASENNQKYIQGNILDKDLLIEIIKTNLPEIIFHLAARAITSSDNPEEALKTNFFGTLNLYQAILDVKKEADYNPKIVYVSSAEVYGKTKNPQNIIEDDPFFPMNYYGVSKVSTDRLSYQLSQTEKLKIIILRPFNHIGPGQQKGFFVPDMASQIVEIERGTKDSLLVGNLESVRDFSDVRDVVQAYKKVIASDFTPGDEFNICSGKGIKMRELLDKLINLSNKEITIKEDPGRIRPSDMPFSVGNNQKFSRKFDWSPKIEIDQTLKDVMEYWRTQW